jgi:hypothetical protein
MHLIPSSSAGTARVISGDTRLLAVLGDPVRHSLSPVMHNAALEALGLDARYLALPVSGDRLAEAVQGLAALGCAGFNVTIPHGADRPAAHAAGTGGPPAGRGEHGAARWRRGLDRHQH